MAEHAHTINPSPNLTRRALALGSGAAAAVGITAGAAASIPPVMAQHPDVELLALRPRLHAALREVNASEMASANSAAITDKEHEDWVSDSGKDLDDVCWKIVDAPCAQTAEGRALKAAAAMYQLRFACCSGHWPGSGEELAWTVLSELAGDAYVPPELPVHLHHNEPARA